MRLISTLLLLLLWVTPLQAAVKKKPQYTTSSACQACHQKQYEAWSESHHGWAWREPLPENVLGDFNNASFQHAGVTYRFITEGQKYSIVADDASGEMKSYRLHSVVGVTPLQQYLVETDNGRLQVLDVTWDTDKKRWYHLYPDDDTSSGTGMHWTRSYKNWNSRCAECHATDFRKNYDVKQDRYNSQQVEIGVGCEACHGPGQAHVEWGNNPEQFIAQQWQEVNRIGLYSTYRTGNSASQINLCAGCHARREPLGANSPRAGANFDDHYRLSLLREDLYFPDGQIKDEVYVYGSFIQSKMHAKGVQCTHCHDAHSYELKLNGNAVCIQCHNEQGHPDFPSLKKSRYDSTKHHFHPAESDSSACVNCHMPSRNYMVVDGRRDHGFRVPRPDLSAKIGAPDVCTGCHQDRDHRWATDSIRLHLEQNRIGEAHFSQVFADIGAGSIKQSVQDLIAIMDDPDQPEVVRASAIDRCVNLPHGLNGEQIGKYTQDQSAVVRMTAIKLTHNLPAEQKFPLLLPLLQDERQSVRIEAVKAMLGANTDQLKNKEKQVFQVAMREFQQAMLAKADFPEGQLVIGGAALTLKRYDAASEAFQRAVTMDPQRIEAWSILIRIKAALGDIETARRTLVTAIQNNPNSYELKELAGGLGMAIENR